MCGREHWPRFISNLHLPISVWYSCNWNGGRWFGKVVQQTNGETKPRLLLCTHLPPLLLQQPCKNVQKVAAEPTGQLPREVDLEETGQVCCDSNAAVGREARKWWWGGGLTQEVGVAHCGTVAQSVAGAFFFKLVSSLPLSIISRDITNPPQKHGYTEHTAEYRSKWWSTIQ